MSGLTLTGQIKVIYDERRISERFNTREFVLLTESDTPYPQSILLQLVNQNCDLIIGKHVGDKVQCNINIKGREWNGPQGVKYFNTIECWRITKDEAE